MTVKHSYINCPERQVVKLELDEESLPAVLTVPDGAQYFFTQDGGIVRMSAHEPQKADLASAIETIRAAGSEATFSKLKKCPRMS